MKKNILINDKSVEIDILNKSSSEITFIYNNQTYQFSKNEIDKKVIFSAPCFVVNGHEIKIESKSSSRTKKNVSDHGQMISPMPGKILKILVNEGADVLAGTPILVMEAMKMEHTIKASKNGKILKIHFKENAQVSAGVELVTLC
jgi:3-methylcrotonyl-CoA carboxylase alpha subunit